MPTYRLQISQCLHAITYITTLYQEYKVLTKFEIYADKLNTIGCHPGYVFKGNMEEYIIKLNIKLLKDRPIKSMFKFDHHIDGVR